MATDSTLTDRTTIARILDGDFRPDDRRFRRVRGDGATVRALLETPLGGVLTSATVTAGGTRAPRGVDELDHALTVVGEARDVADGLRQVLSAPPVAALETLDLRHYVGQFPVIDEPRALASIERLVTASSGPTSDPFEQRACWFMHPAADKLFGSPHAAALRELVLTGWRVRGTNPHAADRSMVDHGTTLSAIGNSPHLERLRVVELDQFEATLGKDIARLGRWPLERLTWRRACLSAGDVERLLATPLRTTLRELEIDSPGVDDALCSALVAFDHLEVLRLRHTTDCFVDPWTVVSGPIGRDGLTALRTASWYPTLRTLDIDGRDPRTLETPHHG